MANTTLMKYLMVFNFLAYAYIGLMCVSVAHAQWNPATPGQPVMIAPGVISTNLGEYSPTRSIDRVQLSCE